MKYAARQNTPTSRLAVAAVGVVPLAGCVSSSQKGAEASGPIGRMESQMGVVNAKLDKVLEVNSSVVAEVQGIHAEVQANATANVTTFSPSVMILGVSALALAGFVVWLAWKAIRRRK